MAVARVSNKKKRRKKSSSSRLSAVRKRGAVSSITLPSQKRKPVSDIALYITMVYGRAGIGKTTLAASYPNCMLMSCERISKGVKAFDFNADNGGVTSWDIFMRGVELLEAGGHYFETTSIDTIESLYYHCMDFVCDRDGVDHPSDGDHGKVWNAVRVEFTEGLTRLINTGLGVVMTSHSKESEIKTRSGDKFFRIQPSMPGQAYNVVMALTDIVCYAEFVKMESGEAARILITEGDELVDAKSPLNMPGLLPMPQFGGYEVLRDALTGVHLGLDIADVYPGRSTSKAGTDRIKRDKTKGGTTPVKRKAVKRIKK